MKKIVGSNKFLAQFIKIISHYKMTGYNINVLQQTACLVVNAITVGNFVFLFNWTPVVLSAYLCFISFKYLDLYVIGDDALIS